MSAEIASFDEIRDRHPTDEIAAKTWLESRLQKALKRGVFAEVIDLTPALAKEFLLHNRENRMIRVAKLGQYIDDIKEGRWELNGEGLIFAKGGVMNDGQHRCEAVVRAGKTIKTIITFGVTRESRQTVDNGAARGPADHLAIEGLEYPMETAAVTRFVLAFERSGNRKMTDTNRVSAAKIVERAMTDLRLGEAAKYGKTAYSKARSVAPASVLGFCYYVFADIHPKIATTYLTGVVTGANLDPESPAYMVRERLIALDRPLRETRMELIFYGWNAHYEGRTLGRMPPIRLELPALAGIAPPPVPEVASADVVLPKGEGGTAVPLILRADDAPKPRKHVKARATSAANS